MMKKITLALLFMLSCFAVSYSQVTIGNGTNQEQGTPFDPYYGFSYTQSIYLASEISASGTITSIQWYFSGNSTLFGSQDLVIYFGHTAKSEFLNSGDFVPVADLTQVYSGGITTTGAPGWVTINLVTPFVYDGTSNLVIAVDENTDDYDSYGDDFHNTLTGSVRSICANSDVVNINPALPYLNQEDFVVINTSSYVPNIILNGISQACTNVSGVTVSAISVSGATVNWVPATGQTNFEIIVQLASLEAPTDSTEGTAVNAT